MSGQQDQQVTVRVLPDGTPHPATSVQLEGNMLRLELAAGPAPMALKAGDLVEVVTAATLYLGVVRSRIEDRATIAVEHSLDRETLATIQQVWHGPGNQ